MTAAPALSRPTRALRREVGAIEPEERPTEEAPAGRVSPTIALAAPLRDLLADPELLREPAQQIPHLTTENATTLFVAREKAGKTTLAAQATTRYLNREPFLGVESGCAAEPRVLWYTIDEPTRDTVIRFRDLGSSPDRLFVSDHPRTLPELLAHLRADLLDQPYTLVVIDTLSRALQQSGIKTNDPDDVGAAVRSIVDVLRTHRVAGLLIYHTNKAGDEYSGAVSIGATVDEIVVLKPRGGDADNDGDGPPIETGKRWLICRGRRLRGSFALEFREGTYELDGSTAEDEIARKILCAAEQADTPLKKSELAAKVKGHRRTKVLGKIDELRADGALAENANKYTISPRGRRQIGVNSDEVDRAV